jgi:hypothetical protein
MGNRLPWRSIAVCIGLLSALGLAAASDAQDEAVAAALAWLSLVDAGSYAESWAEAAPFFKEKVSEDQWIPMVAAARKPFGAMRERQLLGAQFLTTLPGAPDGEYVVIQFQTRFDAKEQANEQAVETVTPMKCEGGWRVSGYFIK